NTHLLYLYDLIDIIKNCLKNSKSNGNIFIVSDDECNTFEKNILNEVIIFFNQKKKILPHPLFWKNKDNRNFSSSKLKNMLGVKFRFGVYAGLKKYLADCICLK
ncbi:NAD(P)-dependent oxidoreductase, partial [Candidatus Dependentiae bacterium]|nr:NAD(P)-dependent oxidoreductase [Candidatus Dependentiae bacterium]